MNVEEVSIEVVDTAYHLHCELGPGLLESVCEAVLPRIPAQKGLRVERRKPVPIDFAGLHFEEGFLR